jgi:hypothetical protein
MGASAGVEAVAAEWGSVAVTAGLGVRYKSVSFGFEVHGNPSTGSLTYLGVGDVRFGRLTSSLLLCYHVVWFSGCALGDAGRLLFPNHVPELPPSLFYLAVGARLSMEFPIAAPRLFLNVSGTLLAPLGGPRSFPTVHGVIFQEAGPGAALTFGPLIELPGW